MNLDKSILNDIREILYSARNKVYQTANNAMVLAYFEIGRAIVEKQGGNEKAEYGADLIKSLSIELTEEFGKGFKTSNLKDMRQFYLTFQKSHALRGELSWTHYRLLMRVENENARKFYEDECVKSNWSTRQLERQINSFFYERLLSSQDKELVSSEILSLEPKTKTAEDIIRDPYVLEFLGLPDQANFAEKDLEEALINHLQKFLLELGRGFSFVARQKRITFDGRHFYIDLLFYNYILKCFVIIDLKIGDLTHQDIGQMQMYVNYYEAEMMNDGDNPPIGIVLCADKSDSLVKYTLPKDSNIYASKYKLYLPSEEELRKELNKEYEQLDIERKLNEG
ncbi:PDDEXK nuclease domain-containing protein [Chakrabartyella piscis]|uniref:PDDEXK nuclease domain-containing protein n=1 Tax=Chakrabartyella piscis TaxID=2918914 RepID=UPI002958AC07|nr:PDDEXK nuclease domain-containing protein [Chakrabartyella piscis]